MNIKNKIAEIFSKGLKNSAYGEEKSFEVLNRISPKYTRNFKSAIDEYSEYENCNDVSKNNFKNNGD
ncbi:MAG: hypothetical protein IJO29_01765 [Oscillospiraceae bacterium]|nr:hypothetical protein [Oscillospiraceae bacterium]